MGAASLQLSGPLHGKLELEANAKALKAATDGLDSGTAVARGAVTVDRLSHALAGTVALDTANIAALAAQLDLPAVTGAVALRAALAGTVTQPAADFELETPALRVAQGPGMKLAAHGRVSLDALQADGTFDRMPLSAFTPVADGAVSGVFSLRGTPRQPEASARVSVEALRAYGELLGDASIDATYGAAGLAVPRFELAKGGGAIAGSMAGAYKGAIEFKNYPIDSPIVTGIVNGRGAFEGPSLELGAGTLNLSIANLVAAGRKPGALALTATLGQGVVKTSAAAPAWGIAATAETSVRAPYASTAEATLRNFALENIAAITGHASGTLRAKGELANPGTLSADADLTSLKVQSGNEEAANQGPIRIHYAAGMADLESVTLISGDSKVTAHGQLPVLQGEAALTWEGDLDVALAARLAQIDPALAPAGRLRAKGTLGGAAPNWRPEGTAEFTGGRINVPGMAAPITGITAAVSVHQDVVTVSEATASWLGGTLRLTGEAPLRAGGYRLQAEASGLRLEQLPNSSQLAGVINLRASAQGKDFTVRGIDATVEAPGLQLQMGELQLTAKSVPTLTVQNGFAQIKNFDLAGSGTAFQIRGGAALVAPYPLALRVDGDLDAALASLFTNAVASQGLAKLHVALTGTAASPRFGGSMELVDVQATIPAANAVVEHLNARADLLGQQITIASANGTINGGTLSAKGTAELKNGTLGNVALEFQSRNSAWNIPDGLQTAANIDLKLEGSGPRQLTLSGDIRILEGSYRERLVIERGLFNVLQPSAAAGTSADGRIALNLNVRLRTLNPILVSNDLLNGAITANLRFLGTLQRPGLTGRLDLEEGGVLYLGGRNYLAERASATFTNERKIEPVLDVLAQTKAGGRQITLEARGAMGNKLETRFTSDDGLPEPDVMALLVTGRTLRETRGAEVDIAGDQALSYLTGSVGGTLSQQANRALGFNFVRIDPSLIAQEAEPTARLTLGQDITARAGLVYSVNLKNSSDQIWIGRVDVTKRFQARVVRQGDNTYRVQFQHGLEFGGDPPAARRRGAAEVLRVGQVTVAGNSPIPEAELRKRFGLRTGKSYDFFRFRKGVDRVKEALSRKGYPEAILRTERKAPAKGTVDLALTVEAGLPVQFVYEGPGVPGRVRRKVESAWSRNSFDSLRSRQAEAVLLEHLSGGGYYEAKVDSAVQYGPDGAKRVLFEIAPGKKQRRLEFAFPGASRENLAGLRELFRDKQARQEAVLKPQRAREMVTEFYRSRGYLEADVKPRVFEKPKPGTLLFSLPVSEGERYRVGKVEVAGASEAVAMPLTAGQAYVPAEADRGAEQIDEALEAKGYTKTATAVEVAPDRAAKTVDLTYRVAPGDKQLVQSVEVEGNRYTSASLVRSQVAMKPGEPISVRKLSQARRNLYDTGAFAFTDLELQPGGAATRLVAKVREVRPYELRYGGLYDTENGPGGILDFSARNVLGAARLIGFRGRYDGQLHEGRAYFEQPNLRRFPMKWVTTGFVRREVNQTFITDRTGGSTTAELRWKQFYRLNAGYRFEQVHTFERQPDPTFPFDIRLRIAPITAGFQRDTRNDILDPQRGSYSSHLAEWAPATLGSQLRYAKYFGQYFRYRPLWGERRFTNAAPRPGLVFAGGARFGIASGLGGQELVPSERFFSGGGTSVRGFAQDTLGAAPGQTPLGGEGLWIANAEARIPLFKYADIVSFLDAGNVYRRWDDLSLTGARFSAGLGVRIRTPYIMLRIDYGIKLNRRPGESFGRLFGGIGQAF